MWLINTLSLELKEFHRDILPPYAILSHCWDDDPSNEVSFQDFRKSRNTESPGMKKITDFCTTAARENGLLWAWVDTCCIDKKSSAHLSEAINSMYRYYEQSAACYVFMNDVLYDGNGNILGSKSWRKSKWWTRGWTLQELLAPRMIRFYDSEWHMIGTKHRFANEISALTNISIFMINGGRHELATFTAGQRLSWTATRTTTRTEDRAYSVLGLLDINMPLLYGERERAFARLQQEILKSTADESILAWNCVDATQFIPLALASFNTNGWKATSVLAESPDVFQYKSDILVVREHDSVGSRRFRPPAVTSWGIELATTAKQLRPNPVSFSTVFGQPPSDGTTPPLLVIPLVVPDTVQSLALTCVLVLAPMPMPGRYGRLCCIATRFRSLKLANFYKPCFDLDDTPEEVTLYLKT